MVKPYFKTPNRLFAVIASIRERLFINRTIPYTFHESAFIGNVDFLGFVVKADLKAISLTKSVGFTATVNSGSSLPLNRADTAVNTDCFCACYKGLRKVLRWLPALKING